MRVLSTVAVVALVLIAAWPGSGLPGVAVAEAAEVGWLSSLDSLPGSGGTNDQQAESTPTPPVDTSEAAVDRDDPGLFTTVTTYLSTAILIGALIWSAWYRRRKRR